MTILWDHVANGIWEIEHCSCRYVDFSPNCGPSQCPQRHAIMTPCAAASTGGWPQLCCGSNCRSCALPAPTQKECTEERQAATSCQQGKRDERRVSTRINPRQGTEPGREDTNPNPQLWAGKAPMKKVLLPLWRASGVVPRNSDSDWQAETLAAYCACSVSCC